MGTRREFIRDFYPSLKDKQHQDAVLEKITVNRIKRYLKNHPACTQVRVDVVSEAQLTEDCTLPSDLPRFLQSQLYAQEYFANSGRPSDQVCAIVRFAAQHLSNSQGAFPTLFRGVDDGTQRSFCLFAYLDVYMPSRKYSIAQLLELRGSKASRPILDQLHGNAEIGDVVRQNLTARSQRQKRAPDANLSSSSDSEEQIVFKGKRQLSRHPINNLDGETQWHYRGRTPSERNSTEPIAAPTGLDAQKSEGFQRFYKAVVSPTHVRVTAGGRIVPNTRGSTSPSAKWDLERAGHDSDSSDFIRQATQPETSTGSGIKDQNANATVPPMMLQPMAHQMYTSTSPMYAQVPVYMTNGLPMPYGLPQTQMQAGPEVQQTRNLSVRVEKQDEVQPQTSKTGAEQVNQRSKPTPIKISPPDQFDQSRPYFFNGSLHYPGSAQYSAQVQGTPITPSPYVGGFPVHPSVARVASGGQPSAMMPMTSPYGVVSPAFAPLMGTEVPNTPQSDAKSDVKSVAATPRASTKPHLTSIKPSQITSSQLTTLNAQLKYFEDQLQYNRHQIDEKATMDQVQSLRKTIENFERNYKRQLKFEQYMRPDDEDFEKALVPAQAPVPAPIQVKTPMTPGFSNNIGGGHSQMGMMRPTQQTYLQSTIDQARQNPAIDKRQRVGINSSRSTDTSEALGALEAHLMKTKKHSIPTRAAMAPIFEPKSATPSLPSQETMGLDFATGTNTAVQSSWELPKAFPADQTTPYLVGQLPMGLSVANTSSSDYTYLRELSDEEKRARHVYWGGVAVKGSGLPKFDGKDFYPPSPVKSLEKSNTTSKSDAVRQAAKSEDPFNMAQSMESSRSAKSTRKISHAVPIINPQTMAREDIDIKVTPSVGIRGDMGADKLRNNTFREQPQLSSPAVATASEGKPIFGSRRGLDRSSKGSSNDLWQNMMKKGPTNGPATLSSVSSTTANGHLPQYVGHASASLTPAITNANSSLCITSGFKGENDNTTQLPKMEKMGENRPPRQSESVIADLHKRMIRDAERRGVIGPGGW